jgi:hypothetical protein
MQLSQPVTINPKIARANGQVQELPPVTLTALEIILVDDVTRRVCRARIRPCPRSVVLWKGAAYDAAGEYTQVQAEARLREVLAPDIKTALEGLFLGHTRP